MTNQLWLLFLQANSYVTLPDDTMQPGPLGRCSCTEQRQLLLAPLMLSVQLM